MSVAPPKKIEVTIRLRLNTFEFDTAFTMLKALYGLLKSCPEVVSIASVNIKKP